MEEYYMDGNERMKTVCCSVWVEEYNYIDVCKKDMKSGYAQWMKVYIVLMSMKDMNSGC
jgi:hypothetical protein